VTVVRGVADTAADQLFRGHPRWRGADDAYSIETRPGRTVWMMADGFIAREGQPREGSIFLNNSVGISEGTDPRTATLTMHWRDVAGTATSYFMDDEPRVWLWPGDGVMVGEHLLLFFSRLTNIDAPPPWNFASIGWSTRLVLNPQDSPDAWWIVRPTEPDLDVVAEVGFGSVLVREGFLYAYAPHSEGGLIARWALDAVDDGRDLTQLEWWTESGWRPHASGDKPVPVLGRVTEFSVHFEPRLGEFLMVECAGMDSGVLVARTAPSPEGPWGEASVAFVPEESGAPGRFLYAGKAHPHLTGAPLWATYVVNDHNPDRMVGDESIYYPRFVALDFLAD
jgi:hypothetical protein